MTDDSMTPEAELASAAFDGEVTPLERARLVASANGSQQLATFARLRTELVAVHVPPDARTTGVAAALAVFDELQESAADTGAPPAQVISLDERRRRQYRWLTGAAAAVAVLVVGTAVLNSGGEDKKTSGSLDAATAQNSQSQKSRTPTQPVPQAGAPTSGTTALATAGSAPIAASTPIAGGINSPAVVTAWALAPSFTTAAEIASYAANPGFGQPAAGSVESGVSTVAGSAADDRAAYNTNCLANVTTPFAAVVFQGQQVLVVRDTTSKQLNVIDPVTCRIVTTIALP